MIRVRVRVRVRIRVRIRVSFRGEVREGQGWGECLGIGVRGLGDLCTRSQPTM